MINCPAVAIAAHVQAQKCCTTISMGALHTGHVSPRALSMRAHSTQHAMCPTRPCTIVAVLACVRHTTQLSSCCSFEPCLCVKQQHTSDDVVLMR
eukprot:4074-Heterococcus_DN1.PRE.1